MWSLRQLKERVLNHDGAGADAVRARVVVVGAGFAGLNAVRALAGAPVEVVLVDRNNYHKFQPLLYQVATAGLEPDEIAHSAREIFRDQSNVRFRLGTVASVDVEEKRLRMQSGPPVDFDYLILAAGAVTNDFGIEGVGDYAFPLKNLPDAVKLRNHVLRRFERYARDPQATGEGALNFVIVGGGPTGVETAGALVELFHHVLQKDYPEVDTRQATVYLLEMLPSLLPAYEEELQTYARETLERRGVVVRTETTVERVERGCVHLEDGEQIPAETLVWAAGVQGSPVGATLGVELGKGGRVPVEDDLSIPGHSDIFVVGDMSGGDDGEGELYAQLAPVAIQQGRHAARQVLRRLAGRRTEPFSYEDKGIMATIGRNAAVAQLPGGLRFKGFVAWFLWVVIHIMQLVGYRNRANVMVNWIYNYFTYDRNARLILDMIPIPEDLDKEVEEVDQEVERRFREMQRSGSV